MSEIKMKQCSKCGRELPANSDYYYKNKDNAGGLVAQCKECVKSVYNSKNDFNFDKWYNNKNKRFRNNWSYDDLKWLYNNYLNLSKDEILLRFEDVSYKTLTNIIYQWDIRKECKNSNWSQGDIDMLYMYYPNADKEELIEMFDRSWDAIKNKASKIGVSRSEEKYSQIMSENQEGVVISIETRIKQSRARKGNKSPNWKGGISTLVPFFRGQLFEWKIKSLEKYGFKCAFTNENNGDLEIHHLYKNFSDILEKTFDMVGLEIKDTIEDYSENEIKKLVKVFNELHFKYGLGVPLSKDIHKLFHIIYGLNNNTKEQFEEFKKRYFNGDFNETLQLFKIKANINKSKTKKRKPYKQLKKEEVVEIKKYLHRGFPVSYIAQQFNCSNGAIYNIKVNKTWTNVN